MAIPPLSGSGMGLGEFLELLRKGVNRSFELRGDDSIHVTSYDGGRNLSFAGNTTVEESSSWVVVEIDSSDDGTSNDSDGNPTQWKYKGYIVRPKMNTKGYGSGSWVRVEIEPPSSPIEVDIFNFREYMNDGSGIQGNGINHDGSSYPENVKMVPLQKGEIYPAMRVSRLESKKGEEDKQTFEYWVNSENGEDGTC